MPIQVSEKTSSNEGGYCIAVDLCPGWHMIADDAEMPLLQQMARIMQLKPSGPNPYPKLLLTRNAPGKETCHYLISASYPPITDDLPINGWESRNFNLFLLWSHPEVPDIICQVLPTRDNSCNSITMGLALYPVFRKMLSAGGFPIHAGLIERNGRGVLLAGPGGTGKSTCCSRVPRPWQRLCDDEVLIVADISNDYNAHPLPTWSDYYFNRPNQQTWETRKGVSLAGLFFLEQADQDRVIALGQGQAAVFISRSVLEIFNRSLFFVPDREKKEIKQKVFECACELARSVPAYRLCFTRTGRFWEKVEDALGWR